MKNREIAQIFERIADCLEFKGESTFRQIAYRRAARALTDLPEDIEEVCTRGDLKSVPGIGSGMAEKIEEYLKTGAIKRYEEASRGVPDQLVAMMRIQGLGPKTLKLLHDALGITTVDQLEAAAREGKLNNLPGMGEKKSENILRGIELFRASSERMLLGVALPLVESIIEKLRGKVDVAQCLPAGSLRRMKETVGDIDILATGANGKKIIDAFAKLPHVSHVLAKGETKGSIITGEGLQVDLRVVPDESYGAALQYFTGSKEHNVHLREIARKKKLKVNEYGVFKGDKSIAGKTEEGVYEALGMEWIPPLLRENRGEIEAAQQRKLPRLIALEDIRGDLHAHSNWSDGKVTIEEMVLAAKEMGYEYIAISDHSVSTTIAGGLTAERLCRQIEEIEKLRKKIKGIAILAATEMDIKPDGALDFPDDLLEKLDIVVASIHSAFKQERKKITSRVLGALENPHVDIIAHPTGRLISGRDPIDIDLEAVMKMAAETGTALEVNSQPERLDLNDVACRRAAELGVGLVVSTDAHTPAQLNSMRFGVATAQRAWATKENVINTRGLKGLRTWLERAYATA